MKIKYRFISETTEIKASDDWGDLFFEFVPQGYNMDHNQIHHQSQTHTLIAWVLTNPPTPLSWDALREAVSAPVPEAAA